MGCDVAAVRPVDAAGQDGGGMRAQLIPQRLERGRAHPALGKQRVKARPVHRFLRCHLADLGGMGRARSHHRERQPDGDGPQDREDETQLREARPRLGRQCRAACVVLACRNPEKGKAALAQIQADEPAGSATLNVPSAAEVARATSVPATVVTTSTAPATSRSAQDESPTRTTGHVGPACTRPLIVTAPAGTPPGPFRPFLST